MPTEILEFRKKPILKITDNTNPLIKIQFGLKKAILIIQNIEAIRQFVENPPEIPGEAPKEKDIS